MLQQTSQTMGHNITYLKQTTIPTLHNIPHQHKLYFSPSLCPNISVVESCHWASLQITQSMHLAQEELGLNTPFLLQFIAILFITLIHCFLHLSWVCSKFNTDMVDIPVHMSAPLNTGLSPFKLHQWIFYAESFSMLTVSGLSHTPSSTKSINKNAIKPMCWIKYNQGCSDLSDHKCNSLINSHTHCLKSISLS